MPRTGRPVLPITLSRDERWQLTRLSKRKQGVSAREAMRARIILAVAGQRGTPPMSGIEIAGLLGVSEQTVSLWRRRFIQGRVAGLTSL